MMLPSVYYKAIQLTLALIAILAFLSLGLAAGNWRADLGIGAALAFLVALLFLVGRASFAGLAKSHWRYALAALLFYLVLSYHFSPAAPLIAAAFGRGAARHRVKCSRLKRSAYQRRLRQARETVGGG